MDKKQSKQQKQWITNFLEKRGPTAKLIKTYNATCGYYYYNFRWHEALPIYLPPHGDELDPGAGWLVKELYVELSPAATERNKRSYVVEIVYPHCSMSYRRSPDTNLQISLPLTQLLLVNKGESTLRKAVSKKRDSRIKKISGLTQHELPLSGVASRMHEIYQRHSENMKSKQDLLAETTEYYSEQLRQIVRLPTAIAILLEELNATQQEWESAALLLGVVGEQGVLMYVEGIPDLRQARLSGTKGFTT